ncbi:hypothetical protein FN846DRAFT_938084 [Sphaerosporella brunnea]|uniref:GPI anchored protein n=1 Tax=Sphaerosporella brunnea TaxID=1250544 RepID=A0A5J5F3K6_9PEZI|nr:hypothetical protein FN846DRAFT_938084 [Sphaerosporella brunnea]
MSRRHSHSTTLLLLLGLLVTTAIAGIPAKPPILHPRHPLLLARAVCSFGSTSCGNGCATGPCCDDAAGVSCEAGTECTNINGKAGCCATGQTCTYVESCSDYAGGSCGEGAGCCPKGAPFCNAQKGVCETLPLRGSEESLLSTSASAFAASSSDTSAAAAATATKTSSVDPLSQTILFDTFVATATGIVTGLVTDTAEAPLSSGFTATATGLAPPYPAGNASRMSFGNGSAPGNMTMFTGGATGRRGCVLTAAAVIGFGMAFALL